MPSNTKLAKLFPYTVRTGHFLVATALFLGRKWRVFAWMVAGATVLLVLLIVAALVWDDHQIKKAEMLLAEIQSLHPGETSDVEVARWISERGGRRTPSVNLDFLAAPPSLGSPEVRSVQAEYELVISSSLNQQFLAPIYEVLIPSGGFPGFVKIMDRIGLRAWVVQGHAEVKEGRLSEIWVQPMLILDDGKILESSIRHGQKIVTDWRQAAKGEAAYEVIRPHIRHSGESLIARMNPNPPSGIREKLLYVDFSCVKGRADCTELCEFTPGVWSEYYKQVEDEARKKELLTPRCQQAMTKFQGRAKE